jgi:hypothetical protein
MDYRSNVHEDPGRWVRTVIEDERCQAAELTNI